MQVIESYIISRRLRRSDLGYLYSFGEHYIGIIRAGFFPPALIIYSDYQRSWGWGGKARTC